MTGLCERCRENEAAHNDVWCPDCVLEVELMLAEDAKQKQDVRVVGINGQYSIADFEVHIAEFEEEYGLPSDAVLEMHRQDRAPIGLPERDRHLWMSMYRQLLEEKRKWANF